MSTCRRCNRVLKREPYRSLGIGKICSAKEAAERESRANGDDSGDIYVPYDGGDIFMERISAPTLTPGMQLSLAKHTASGIKTNVIRSIVKHSPAGLQFGYSGSGPADAALNILHMFTDRSTAEKHYQAFKEKFLVTQDDRLVIPRSAIENFIIEAKSTEPVYENY